jgi:cysteine desulfurase
MYPIGLSPEFLSVRANTLVTKHRPREKSGMYVYLDYNASTPVADEVLAAMTPWFGANWANPGSQHAMGRAANDAVERARRKVAELVNCRPSEIIFTSGATEANNLAFKGVPWEVCGMRSRILTVATEHHAVLEPLNDMSKLDFKIDVLPVTRTGELDFGVLRDALGDDVALVSVMLVNNETGVIQRIAEIAELAHSVGALVHTDATQAVGRIPVDVAKLGVDLAAMSAHKMYGPKGIGALYVRRGGSLHPAVHGGGQERGLRSGTENVPAIVGFGEAARIAQSTMSADRARFDDLRAVLLAALWVAGDVELVIPESISSDSARCAPWTVSVRFRGADAEAVLANCPNVAISTGSACTSGVPGPSHVLLAVLGDYVAASECLRLSMGRFTTEGEVLAAAAEIVAAVRRVRAMV